MSRIAAKQPGYLQRVPSWCDNVLDVWANDSSGDDALADFIRSSADGDQPLRLFRIRPEPASIEDEERVIQWRHLHWGTKWDIDGCRTRSVTRGMRFYFRSAWSGPTYWCEYASALYPELRFRLTYVVADESRVATLTFQAGRLIDGEEAQAAVGASRDSFLAAANRTLQAVNAGELLEALTSD